MFQGGVSLPDHNYLHLLELGVLFYVLCLVLRSQIALMHAFFGWHGHTSPLGQLAGSCILPITTGSAASSCLPPAML